MNTQTGYLLYWYRTTPGLTGDPCTHVGVWPSLEAAQAYSDQCGGQGEWSQDEYDAIRYWIRTGAREHETHCIEEIAVTGVDDDR